MRTQLSILGTLIALSASQAALGGSPMARPDGAQGVLIPVTVIQDGVRKEVGVDDESYNFDDGPQGWQSFSGITGDTWHVEATSPNDGAMTDVWWSGDPVEGGYLSSSFVFLQTPAINFSGATAGATLTFSLFYATEAPGGEPAGYNGWDGCNVWASTDGGTTWNPISGTPAYNVSSSYAFGVEFGMGVGIPTWGGTNGAFQNASFNLGAFAGQSDLRLRFVMCADGAYDHSDDPDLTGMEVDNIVVNNGSSTVWSDNGTTNVGGAMSHGTPVVSDGNLWVHSATGGNPDGQWVCDDGINLQCYVTSPNITGIVPPAVVSISSDINCDLPDWEGEDNALEDYFRIEYSTDGGTTWATATYDYFHDTLVNGWILYEEGVNWNGSLTYTLETETQFMIRYRVITDENNDGGDGTGMHVDNVVLTVDSVPLHDVAITKAWFDYPRAANDFQLPKVEISNVGASTEVGVHATWKVYADSLNGAVVHNTTFSHTIGVNLNPLTSTRVEMVPADAGIFQWMPTAAGTYVVEFSFAGVTGDVNTANDKLFYTLVVTPDNVGFLRYNQGLANVWTLGPDDGFLVRFDPITQGAWDPQFINMLVYQQVAGDQVNFVIHDEGVDDQTIGPLLAQYPLTVSGATEVYPNYLNRYIGDVPFLKCRNTPVWMGIRGSSLNVVKIVGLATTAGGPYWESHTNVYDYTDGQTYLHGGDLNIFAQVGWDTEAEIPFTIDLESDLVFSPNATIALSWNSPGPVDGYAVHASTNAYFTPSAGTLVATLDKFTTTYSGNASVAGSKLYYKVIGFNSVCP